MPDINRLQPFQRGDELNQAIFNAETTQENDRSSSISDLRAQEDVSTATWGLSIFEQEYGIVSDPTQTYDERRSVVTSKMRSPGTVNKALIASVANSYTNGDVAVTFANSTITITFTSVVGVPPNIDQCKAAISDILPAHLAVSYVYKYNLWSQIAAKTWSQIAAYTWDQVMNDAAVVS